jgi:hypothetical protein
MHTVRRRSRAAVAVALAALCAALAPGGIARPDAARAAPPPGPTVFAPGVISSPQDEWRITFTPDGRTAYFGRSAGFFPVTREATIYESTWRDGAWSTPVPAPFSGAYSDIDPFVTADGQRLYFSSIRPVDGQERTDADVWVVERTGSGWGEPVNIGAANGPADELYPSVAADGTLYVGSDRPGGLGGWDIYRARPGPDGGYGPAENVGAPVNSAVWEFNPTVLPGGNALVFASIDRPGGYGYGDLWASVRGRGGWTTPRNLGPTVNTAEDEYHPSFSPRLGRFYFVRHEYGPSVPGDIYTIPTLALLLPLIAPGATGTTPAD